MKGKIYMLNNEELRKIYSQLGLAKAKYQQEISFIKKKDKNNPMADLLIAMNENMIAEIDYLLKRLDSERIFDDE